MLLHCFKDFLGDTMAIGNSAAYAKAAYSLGEQPALGRFSECGKLFGSTVEKCIRADQKGTGAQSGQHRKD